MTFSVTKGLQSVYNPDLKMQPFHLATQALGDPTHTAPPLAPLQQNTSLPAAKFSIHSGIEISLETSLVLLVLARQQDWVQI